MLRITVVLACCTTALAQFSSQNCGKPQRYSTPADGWMPGSRIVGGKNAGENSWPWIGALIKQKPGYYPYQFCGGTLIANQWFVTAGHCVDTLSDFDITQEVKIVLGVNNLNNRKPENVFDVCRVVKHDEYDNPPGSTNNDIALLKLCKPVKYGPTIQPACLPTRPFDDLTNAAHTNAANAQGKNRRVAFVAGWGHLEENQDRQWDQSRSDTPPIGAGTEQLQQVNIDMYSQDDCKRKLRGMAFTDKMICGGFDQGGKDSCQGDSGGPLVAKNKAGVYEHIGVVSFGAGCARANTPGVYANVYNLLPWIKEKIQTN